MSETSLIVPVPLPSGTLDFAEVNKDSVVQDVIQSLTTLEEVQKDILGEWICGKWALRRVRKKPPARLWEESELKALSDGLLPNDALVQSLLVPSSSNSQASRHFSAVPFTSHLHAPSLRLVAMHPHLMLNVSFLRVPEVHDGFRWLVFLARTSAVEDVLECVADDLGLTKFIEGPGGRTVNYIGVVKLRK